MDEVDYESIPPTIIQDRRPRQTLYRQLRKAVDRAVKENAPIAGANANAIRAELPLEDAEAAAEWRKWSGFIRAAAWLLNGGYGNVEPNDLYNKLSRLVNPRLYDYDSEG